MNKITLTFLSSFVTLFSWAQINFPFPTDSVEWTYFNHLGADDPAQQLTYHYGSDTTISSTVYSKLYFNFSNEHDVNYYAGALRTDSLGKKVYFVKPDSVNEHMLYDFTINIDDTIHYAHSYLILKDTSRILIKGEMRKKFRFSSGNVWIEGIGDTIQLLRPYEYVLPLPYSFKLRCFHQQDSLIYLNNDFEDCIHDNTGIKEINKIEVSIYPNPIEHTSILQIENSNYHNLSINIYNSFGELITSDNIPKNQYVINSKQYSSGIHFYRIESDKGELLKSGKIIIN